MHPLMKKNETREMHITRQIIAAIALLCMLITMQIGLTPAYAEDFTVYIEEESGEDDTSFVILDDPEYFLIDEDEEEPTDWEAYYEALAGQEVDGMPTDDEEDAQDNDLDAEELMEESPQDAPEVQSLYPVITSIGKENVKLHGVRSKNKLLPYTIPEELLAADSNFCALMIEAEKYIGYPYVYGESNPKTGFDCSGFVSWVFMHSGVYDTGRRGANGLHSLCEDVDPADARPGDLIFFERTMGADVDGITHVGIYVGNNMMIHAGDPVGFADLSEEKWIKRFHCYGRLPVKEN